MRSSLDLFKWSAWLMASCALPGCAHQPALQTAAEAERLDSAGLVPRAEKGSGLLDVLAGTPATAATVQADGVSYSLGAIYDAASGLRCRKVLSGPPAHLGRVACEGTGGWQWAAPAVEEGTR